MPTFVWVYGGSASGKQTFIERLINGYSPDIKELLGWRDKNIVSVRESIEYIGQFGDDPVTLKRSEIIDAAKAFSKDENAIVLIKGQDVDLHRNLPRKMQKEIPSANHEIIYLYSNLETLYSRVRLKQWWKKGSDDMCLNHYLNSIVKQINLLNKLKEFNIIKVDSSHTEYRIIYLPLLIIEKLFKFQRFRLLASCKLSAFMNFKYLLSKAK